MAAINQLIVELRTRSERFTRGMRDASSEVEGFRSRVALLSAGLVGLAGAAGMGRLVTSTIDAQDKLAKLSTRLGASTEALSEYQFAAESAGVPFDALVTSWQRQARRVSEAAQGYGTAEKALTELNFDVKELNKLKPEDQFEAIAEELSKVENQADKVRLAMKIWDTEGVKNLQLIEGGIDGLREYRSEARKLGLTLTKEQAKGAEDASQAMLNLESAIAGLKKQTADALIGPFTRMVTWFSELIPRVVLIAKGSFASFEQATLRLASTVAKFVGADVLGESLAMSADEAKQRFDAIRQELDDLYNGVKEPLVIKIDRSSLIGSSTPAAAAKDNPAIVSNELEIASGMTLVESLETLDEIRADAHRKEMLRMQERKEMQRNAVSGTKTFLSNMSALITDNGKKNAKSWRNLALFQAGIDTAAAAMGAFKAMIGIPIAGPTLAVAAAGAATAFGLKQMAMIRNNNYAGAFAEGGFIPGGQFGIVGEAGPELVKGPAQVTSAEDTAIAMRKPNININIYSQTGKVDARSVDQVRTAAYRGMLKSSMRNL